VRQLRDIGGGPVHAVECDVSDPDQVRAAMVTTLSHCRRADSLFANAGGELQRPFLKWTLEDWERVLRLDLTSVFLCFQEAARHMVSRGGGGKLVVTTSVGTVFGMPTRPAYSAAKAGCEALVRSLAVELARHDIQVNAVQPGWIETPFVTSYKQDDASNRAIEGRTPARRWGQPPDLEGIAVYLASDASRFHTGDTIRVDGGYAVM
jgi:NAD(P)-dependent dehydrogenase (short-subunit alcohol dehydrogenase family)